VGSYGGLMRLLPSSKNSTSQEGKTGTFKFERLYKRFGNTLPLLKSPVLALLEDHSGIVWVKTADGLVRLEPPTTPTQRIAGRLRYKSYSYDKFVYRIGALLEVPGKLGGQLWINLKDRGFTIFNPKTETFLNIVGDNEDKTDTSIPFFINTIYKDRNGIMWFGTETDGLFKYDSYSTRFSNYNLKLNKINWGIHFSPANELLIIS